MSKAPVLKMSIVTSCSFSDSPRSVGAEFKSVMMVPLSPREALLSATGWCDWLEAKLKAYGSAFARGCRIESAQGLIEGDRRLVEVVLRSSGYVAEDEDDARASLLWRSQSVLDCLGLQGAAWMSDYRRMAQSVQEAAEESASFGALLERADLALIVEQGALGLPKRSL